MKYNNKLIPKKMNFKPQNMKVAGNDWGVHRLMNKLVKDETYTMSTYPKHRIKLKLEYNKESIITRCNFYNPDYYKLRGEFNINSFAGFDVLNYNNIYKDYKHFLEVKDMDWVNEQFPNLIPYYVLAFVISNSWELTDRYKTLYHIYLDACRKRYIMDNNITEEQFDNILKLLENTATFTIGSKMLLDLELNLNRDSFKILKNRIVSTHIYSKDNVVIEYQTRETSSYEQDVKFRNTHKLINQLD